MKIVLTLLVLLFSTSVVAGDISNLRINKIGLFESLSSYYSKSEIKKTIEDYKDYYVKFGYDTTYITWFSGFEVPIVNGASYSDLDGYVSTMIAPVKTMLGDTATIYYGYYDNWLDEDTYGEFNVIFN